MSELDSKPSKSWAIFQCMTGTCPLCFRLPWDVGTTRKHPLLSLKHREFLQDIPKLFPAQWGHPRDEDAEMSLNPHKGHPAVPMMRGDFKRIIPTFNHKIT